MKEDNVPKTYVPLVQNCSKCGHVLVPMSGKAEGKVFNYFDCPTCLEKAEKDPMFRKRGEKLV